jgi:hypothetical protein
MILLQHQWMTSEFKIKPCHMQSMRSVVKIQKKITMSVLAGGTEVGSSYASITAYGNRLWFGDIHRRHNDDTDDFHFSYPHKVFCIGNGALNAGGRNISQSSQYVGHSEHCSCPSGWPVCMSGDGTGRISCNKVTMVSFSVNSIPANLKFNMLNHVIGPIKNKDLYLQSWTGVKKQKWLYCGLEVLCHVLCALQDCPLITQLLTVAEVVEFPEMERLIHSTKLDNADLFHNFARSIDASR